MIGKQYLSDMAQPLAYHKFDIQTVPTIPCAEHATSAIDRRTIRQQLSQHHSVTIHHNCTSPLCHANIDSWEINFHRTSWLTSDHKTRTARWSVPDPIHYVCRLPIDPLTESVNSTSQHLTVRVIVCLNFTTPNFHQSANTKPHRAHAVKLLIRIKKQWG